MVRCKDLLLQGHKLSKEDGLLLLTTGIASFRRSLAGSSESDDYQTLLERTATLVFVLIVIGDAKPEASASDEALLAEYASASLWSIIHPPKRKRRDAEGEAGPSNLSNLPGVDATMEDDRTEASSVAAGVEGAARAEGEEAASRWDEVLRGPSAISSAALRVAAAKMATCEERAMAELASTFFRASVAHMMGSMLCAKKEDDDFLTLSACRFAAAVDSAVDISNSVELQTLVGAAESDNGQQVVRDITLSFLLPADLVGVRRFLLLPRARSIKATAEHSEIVQRAHELAMQGVKWTWQHTNDRFERMICILAGIAMLTTRGEDAIRKVDAFGGRVQFPFLETRQPSDDRLLRIALVPSARRWVSYRMRRGQPEVVSSGKGLDGLAQAALQLRSELKF